MEKLLCFIVKCINTKINAFVNNIEVWENSTRKNNFNFIKDNYRGVFLAFIYSEFFYHIPNYNESKNIRVIPNLVKPLSFELILLLEYLTIIRAFNLKVHKEIIKCSSEKKTFRIKRFLRCDCIIHNYYN